MKTRFLFITLLMLLPLYVQALTSTHDGKGPRFWDAFSVAVASVDGVITNQDHQFSLKLHILDPITGHASIKKDSIFEADLDRHPRRLDILSSVKVNSTVVILFNFLPGESRCFIPADFFTFMPTGCAIMEVDGLSDPKVQLMREQIAKLQKISAENARTGRYIPDFATNSLHRVPAGASKQPDNSDSKSTNAVKQTPPQPSPLLPDASCKAGEVKKVPDNSALTPTNAARPANPPAPRQ